MLGFELQVWLIHRCKKEEGSSVGNSCPELWWVCPWKTMQRSALLQMNSSRKCHGWFFQGT